MIPASAIPVAANQNDGPASPPAAYYGTAMINGDPAPSGTIIEAEINGTVRGNITIRKPGRYGDATAGGDKLIVEGNSSDTEQPVTFYIETADGDRYRVNTTDPDRIAWEPGDLTQVDLSLTTDEASATISNVSATPGESAVTVNMTFSGQIQNDTAYISIRSDEGEPLISSLVQVHTNMSDVGINLNLTRAVKDETITVNVAETQSMSPELASTTVSIRAAESASTTGPSALTPTPVRNSVGTETTSTTKNPPTLPADTTSTGNNSSREVATKERHTTTAIETTQSEIPGFRPLTVIMLLITAMLLAILRSPSR